MTIGAISNKPSLSGSESPGSPATLMDKEGFSLDLGKAAAPSAPPEARIASLPEEGDRAGMEAYCTNAFNRLVRDMNELFDLLARNDPSLEEKLDDLDLRINTLITFCRDFLPQSAMSDLRGMRELIDSLRGALGFDADQSQTLALPQVDWSIVSAIRDELWEIVQRLAPLLGGGPANRPVF